MATGAVLGVGAWYYASRLKTLASIRQETFSGTPYDLYTMDVYYPYYADRIVWRGLGDNQQSINSFLREALPFLPVHLRAPDFSCSAFTFASGKSVLMGRNYDFSLDTSAMLVRCAPRGGYRSIATCALDNLGANNPLSSVKTRLACLAAPFACLDGMNEKGVSIGVLILDSTPTRQDTGRPKISTTMAIRLVLDKAATTQEAVDLLRSYDMFSNSGRDYHFYISDASGDARVVEYDCDSPTREMHDTPARQVTNFFVMHADKVTQVGKNGRYGHGLDRYEAIAQVLDEAEESAGEDGPGSSEAAAHEVAWEALRASSQEPNPDDVTSNTQWSIVFDKTNLTADIAVRRRWDDVHYESVFMV